MRLMDGVSGKAALGKYRFFHNLKHRVWLLMKWLLFPGFNLATRKRMRLCKYLIPGDIATLDAGCGNGAFSFRAYKLGNQVLGISFNPGEIKRCEEFRAYLGINAERCRFKVHNVYDILNLKRCFDQIICFETLEHLDRDQEVLALFARVLNRGGVVHLCSPRLDRKPSRGEVISSVEDGGHVRLGYTPAIFKSMLEKEGFVLEVQDCVLGVVGQAIANFGRWLHAIPLGRFPPAIREATAGMIVLALSPISWLDRFWLRSKHLSIYVRARLKEPGTRI